MTVSKIRVLIVDDSALMRKKIAEIINSSPDCEVIGLARDGYEALNVIQSLKPDVVTLDLQLPKMDGLTCLVYIMSEWPTPVIVLSAFTTEGSKIAVKALEYGAIDFIAKPEGVISPGIHKINKELLNKIRLASKVPVENLKILSAQKANSLKQEPRKGTPKIVLLGASTGGPRAVMQILRELPANFPAAIIVIQHMPKYFIPSFVQRLNEQCDLDVKEAEDEDSIIPGRVLVAPGGYLMEVVKANESKNFTAKISLVETSLQHLSPSIDAVFSSAAQTFGTHTLGIILTGMGKDGTKGCVEIKQCGGTTIAEDESSCIVFGMPAAAIAAQAIDSVLPLDQIAKAILTEVSSSNG